MVTYHCPIYNAHGEIQWNSMTLTEGVITSCSHEDERDNPEYFITPGLVDVHCHGGGGASFPDDLDEDSIRTAIHTHRAAGTTALVASLVSAIDPLPAIHALVPFCEQGELAGIHMEGPYISPHKAGAQSPAAIRSIDLGELEEWLKAGRGWIRTMTLAPEREGAREAAKLLLSYGARPSWGHTDCSDEIMNEAIHATAQYARENGGPLCPQTITHMFNAMNSIHHRSPGPIPGILEEGKRENVAIELIGDGIHIHPNLVARILRNMEENDGAHTPFMLVTDAMAAAGMPEGLYTLGGLDVTVKGMTATLTGSDTIAGGCTKLSDQITALHDYVPLPTLIRSCTEHPYTHVVENSTTRAMGYTPSFEEGDSPSFIVWDAHSFTVKEVYRCGKLVSKL